MLFEDHGAPDEQEREHCKTDGDTPPSPSRKEELGN
jgi:hypothetical protein